MNLFMLHYFHGLFVWWHPDVSGGSWLRLQNQSVTSLTRLQNCGCILKFIWLYSMCHWAVRMGCKGLSSKDHCYYEYLHNTSQQTSSQCNVTQQNKWKDYSLCQKLARTLKRDTRKKHSKICCAGVNRDSSSSLLPLSVRIVFKSGCEILMF